MHKYTKISILSPLFSRSWVNEYYLSDKKMIWDSNLLITKLTNWAIFVQTKGKSSHWRPCSGFVFEPRGAVFPRSMTLVHKF